VFLFCGSRRKTLGSEHELLDAKFTHLIEEKIPPPEKCFFLTPFKEFIGSWPNPDGNSYVNERSASSLAHEPSLIE
jgi:hypothetical protein